MKNTLNNPFDSAYNATETTDVMETVIFAKMKSVNKPKIGEYNYELNLLAKSQKVNAVFVDGRIEGDISGVSAITKLFKKSVENN